MKNREESENKLLSMTLLSILAKESPWNINGELLKNDDNLLFAIRDLCLNGYLESKNGKLNVSNSGKSLVKKYNLWNSHKSIKKELILAREKNNCI